MDVLRIATAGSVDDGKSSLIGRLLYDSKNLYDDQLAAVERASEQRGSHALELALLTDGLRAEREQNITIDVAYRYFTTPVRKFIIADTPGHLQYTRNMVTGVSRVDVSVILVDASKGLLPQSNRHAAISMIFGVPVLVVVVNKMDLIDWNQGRFEAIQADFRSLAQNLGNPQLAFIPASALHGDNVVDRSTRSDWYKGPTLLEFLESVKFPEEPKEQPFRMLVQHVIRSDEQYRGLAGTPISGTIRNRDTVTILPGGGAATVATIRTPDGAVDQSERGVPLTIQLAENVDVGRGTMISASASLPEIREFTAVVSWMAETPLVAGRDLLFQQGPRRVAGRADAVTNEFEISNLTEQPAERLENNGLGTVRFRTSEPLFLEPFANRRELGKVLLIDPTTFATVGAALVKTVHTQSGPTTTIALSAKTREIRGHAAATVAEAIAKDHPEVAVITLDELESGLNSDLPDPIEATRRARELAAILNQFGRPVLLVGDQLGDHAVMIDADSDAVRAEILAWFSGY
jgi:sulfate adenylyltransferase large subunit